MPRLVRALVLGALLGALLGGSARTDCAQAVEWRGQDYQAVADATATLSLARRIGEGVNPCGDPACAGQRERLTVLRIEGVRPDVAVGVEEDAAVYAARGYFIQQRSHPLHGALHDSRERRHQRQRRACDGAADHVGTVTESPLFELRVDVEGADEPLAPQIDFRTRFVGLERNGLAYVAEGTRVRVRTLSCAGRGGRSTMVAQAVVAIG
jgi:hypothetical protein